jgi:hypothetical protein
MDFRTRKVVFRFTGGFLDGQTVDGADETADNFVFLSDNGRVGARFRLLSPERREAIARLLEEFFALSTGDDIDPHGRMVELGQDLKKFAFQNFEVRARVDEPDRTIVDVHYIGEEIESYGF